MDSSCTKTRLIIQSAEDKQKTFHDIHERLAEDSTVNAMSSYRRKDSAYQKISNRFFGHNMLSDVADYIKRRELQSVSAPT